jgi:hypothetical protein
MGGNDCSCAKGHIERGKLDRKALVAEWNRGRG